MDEWEAAGGSMLSIFGDVIEDTSVDYANGAHRGCNTVSFGHYGDPGVIGVTTVWGYFSGPPKNREIVEAHVLLNDDFTWGEAEPDGSSTDLMDVQNILTHELGHVAGMGDLYDSGASEETMYGYSTEGETKKRDLYVGDIAGIVGLYE